MSTSSERALNPREAQYLIQTAIRNQSPFLLVGPPGCGKTDIVSQAAEATGHELMILHPVVSDPTDFKGIPFVTQYEDRPPSAAFEPTADLRRMLNAPRPLLVFLDDLGQAAPQTQAAAMQLLLARAINGHKLSNHVTLAAATNRREDRAGVSGILEPVKSRFNYVIEIRQDIDCWTRWALSHNVPVEMIAFMRMRPDLLTSWQPSPDIALQSPCARTIAKAATNWTNIRAANGSIPEDLKPKLEFASVSTAAGPGFASEFMGFVAVFDELPNIDECIADPHNAPVPEEASVRFAVSRALALRMTPSNIDPIADYLERMPAEYQAVAMRDGMATAKANGHPIVNTRRFISWTCEHPDLF